MVTKVDSLDAELVAVKKVCEALAPLEGTARRVVLKMVSARLGESLLLEEEESSEETDRSPRTERHGSETGSGSAAPSPSNDQTAKEFIKAKRPISEVQRVACLAYYLAHNKSQHQFKTKDLTLLNSTAGENELSNPSMTIGNAINHHGLLARAAGGNKRITNVGEAVVEALPN